MFERHHEPLSSRGAYYRRIVRSGGVATAVVSAALFAGVGGYHWSSSWSPAFFSPP